MGARNWECRVAGRGTMTVSSVAQIAVDSWVCGIGNVGVVRTSIGTVGDSASETGSANGVAGGGAGVVSTGMGTSVGTGCSGGTTTVGGILGAVA